MKKLRLFFTAAAIISLSACATVDMTNTTSVSMKAQSSAVERNVVQRAASKLYAAFTTKGWSTKSSKKRVQSAASILLKGLEPIQANSGYAYADQNKPAMIVLADMREATQHVFQTTKAAEVYLSMAPAQDSLREELSSLERALLMSRQAETVFAAALESSGRTDTSETLAFVQSVDALRDVTNAFGERVREEQTLKVVSAS